MNDLIPDTDNDKFSQSMAKYWEEKENVIKQEKSVENRKFWAMMIITLLSLFLATYQTYLSHIQTIITQEQRVQLKEAQRSLDSLR